jgi:hypothetical protein
VQAIRAALDLPLKVVWLAVPLAVIEQRLASDVTSGRRDNLREAAEQIATAEGVGLEDVTIVNDRPVGRRMPTADSPTDCAGRRY